MNFFGVAKIIFHAIPILVAFTGRKYLTLAAFLLVLVPYIKVRKFRQLLDDHSAGLNKGDHERLQKNYNFWKKITFF